MSGCTGGHGRGGETTAKKLGIGGPVGLIPRARCLWKSSPPCNGDQMFI